MILRDGWDTSYDVASLFVAGAQTHRHRWNEKSQTDGLKSRKAHRHEAVSSALNFPFLKEVSQNCFVFEVVNFEKLGSLAELLRFLMFATLKNEDVL